MALATYTDLKASIAGWLNRSDLTARIPDFIALAEAAMSRRLRVSEMIVRATATTDDEFVALPTGYLEDVAVALSGGEALQPMSHDRLVAAKAQAAEVGEPRFYARVGESLQLYPAPDRSYTLAMTYYGKPTALSDSVASNWILAKAPDAYLYGALLQAAPYLRDAERLSAWSGLYQGAMNGIEASDVVPRGALRVDAGLQAVSARRGYNIRTDL